VGKGREEEKVLGRNRGMRNSIIVSFGKKVVITVEGAGGMHLSEGERARRGKGGKAPPFWKEENKWSHNLIESRGLVDNKKGKKRGDLRPRSFPVSLSQSVQRVKGGEGATVWWKGEKGDTIKRDPREVLVRCPLTGQRNTTSVSQRKRGPLQKEGKKLPVFCQKKA